MGGKPAGIRHAAGAKHLCSPLASISATREIVERFGLGLKKSFGQNFLVNDSVICRILSLSEVSSEDTVLEIGPGIGTLTWALLDNACKVVAIERDSTLVPVLAETLGGFSGKFCLVEGDAIDVIASGLKDLGCDECGRLECGSFECGRLECGRPMSNPMPNLVPNKLISNLPYSVASTIVLDAFQKIPSIESMTVMVQREVAERMCATPGTKSYGAYTVKLAMYAASGESFNVSPACFMPPPHVDSTVLRLNRREAPADTDVVRAACTMADAAFFARRKTISNSCKQYFASHGMDSACALQVIEAAGIDPGIRGEVLEVADYLRLGEALQKTLHPAG